MKMFYFADPEVIFPRLPSIQIFHPFFHFTDMKPNDYTIINLSNT